MTESKDAAPKKPGTYQVLARRFRPKRFGDVVGQEAVVRTLQSCLGGGRLPHAFLFCGSRGVGKTTSARILARAVNCAEGVTSDPCGECEPCREILAGSASDVIELDAASHNGVDEVRALREQAGYAPLRLRKKVFVLDEVHMFSRSAFNALLKVLEEPPEHVVFVLATTELHKVPDTVQSRCQVLTFRRIQEKDIRARLQQIAAQEGVTVDPEILAEIATSSLGGLRDAETALERVLPLADGLDLEGYRQLEGRLGFARTAELVESCLAGDSAGALRFAFEAATTGVDERECLGEILDLLRKLFVLRVDGPDSMWIEAGGESRERLQKLAASTELEALDARMQILILARDRIRQIDDRRIFFELTLVRLARIAELVSLGEIAASAAPAGAGAPPAAAPAPASSAAPFEPAPPSRGSVAPGPAPSRPAPKDAPAASPSGSLWQRLVETALDEKKMIGAVLGRGRLEWEGETQARLHFDDVKPFDRRLLEAENTAQYLQELFRRVCARAVTVELVLGAAKPAEASAAADSAVAGPAKPSPDSRAPTQRAEPRGGPARSPEARSREASTRESAARKAQAPEPGEPLQDVELPPLGSEVRDLFGARLLEKPSSEQDEGESQSSP